MYGPGGSYERLVQDYLKRSLTNDDDIFRAFNGVLNMVESSLGTRFVEGLPKNRLDSSILWVTPRRTTRRKGFPSFSWLGWKGMAIWPEHDLIPHPFLRVAVADNRNWYLNDTYIEWFERGNGNQRKAVRNSGSGPAYSWIPSVFHRIKPRDPTKDSFAQDRMGRPVDYEWKQKKVKEVARESPKRTPTDSEDESDLPHGPNVLDTLPPRAVDMSDEFAASRFPDATTHQAFLSFTAAVALVELHEDDRNVQSNKIFRYIALRAPGGKIVGYVTVSDGFKLKRGSRSNVVILSSVPHNMGLSIATNVMGDLGDNGIEIYGSSSEEDQLMEMLKCAYNVMLIEPEGRFAVRAGTGFMVQSDLALVECEWRPG